MMKVAVSFLRVSSSSSASRISLPSSSLLGPVSYPTPLCSSSLHSSLLTSSSSNEVRTCWKWGMGMGSGRWMGTRSQEKEEEGLDEDIQVVMDEKCWSCDAFQKKRRALFCVDCKLIQPPPKKSNYFHIFGLEPHYDIDVKKLSKKYQQLQKQVHPDQYASKSKPEFQFSQKHSLLVTTAFSTLKEPSLRAAYLLELCGYKDAGEADTQMEQQFLMWVMDLQERVDDAADQLSSSPSEAKQVLREALKEVDEEGEETNQALKEVFEGGEGKEVNVKEGAKLMKKLNFLHRLEQTILDHLEPTHA